MAYQVIARKWRPQRFSDMVGQEHIARTLRNAIMTGRIAQAYLFVGPRGIGKTTSARIFAKALNCKHPVDGEPCCECDSCVAIANESSVDVIEIDAATHTQVEKAREICEEVLHLPIASKYKIYIIDEVHMLSKSAWNALLKTIEEPPEHAKFIFATTEVNKVLPTVISRCQRFDLKRIPTNLIAERLALIAKTEGVRISPSAIDVIARAADGGMRDAQSLLDQMISFFSNADGENTISEAQALSLFGLTAPAEMSGLIQALLCNDRPAVVTAIHNFAAAGKNLELLFDEILVWLRGVLMCSLLPNPESVLEESQEKIRIYAELARLVRPDNVQRLLEQLSSTGFLLREAINKQIFIETLLLKAMRMAHAVQVDDLIARLNYIRKNGELAPLDAVPAYVTLPPPRVVIRRSEERETEHSASSPRPLSADTGSAASRTETAVPAPPSPKAVSDIQPQEPSSAASGKSPSPASIGEERSAAPCTPETDPAPKSETEKLPEQKMQEVSPRNAASEGREESARRPVPAPGKIESSPEAAEKKKAPSPMPGKAEPSGAAEQPVPTPTSAQTAPSPAAAAKPEPDQPASEETRSGSSLSEVAVSTPSAGNEIPGEDSFEEESSEDADELGSDEDSAAGSGDALDLARILGKRKSVEELISEVRDIPIVSEIVRNFGGRLVDVHEMTEDPNKS